MDAGARKELEDRQRRREKAGAVRDRIIARGNRSFKDTGFSTASQMAGNIRGFVSTGLPVLDIVLSGRAGGGFAVARFSELLGEADVGKTTLGCYLMRQVQEQDGLAVVVDTEKTLSERRLAELGVDLSRLLVIEDTVIESICDRLLLVLEELGQTPSVIFWDTIAATRSQRDKGRKIGESRGIGLHAQVLAQAFRVMTEPLSRSRCAMVLCNQRKQGDIGAMFANARKRDASLGGDAVKFAPAQRLKLSFSGTRKDETQSAYVVNADVLKNKVSPTRLRACLMMRQTGTVAQFDPAESLAETMVKWGAWADGKVLLRVDGERITRAQFAQRYPLDAAFRAKVHALAEEAHDRLNARGAEAE